MIGIKAGHEVLKKSTQSNLSMFHNAGTFDDSKVLPQPSVKEVLKNNKKYLGYITAEFDNFKIFHKDLCYIEVKDLVTSIEYYDQLDKNQIEYVSYICSDIIQEKPFLRFKFDVFKIVDYGYYFKDFCELIMREIDLEYFVSASFQGFIDIVYSSSVKIVDQILSIKINKNSSLQSLYVYNEDDKNILTGFIKHDKPNCYSIINLINNKLINSNTIYCNNIEEVYSIFGIEAVVTVLVDILGDESKILIDILSRSGEYVGMNSSTIINNRGVFIGITFERFKQIMRKVFMDKSVYEEDIESIYAKYMTNTFGSRELRIVHNELKDFLLSSNKNKTILDIGSGQGGDINKWKKYKQKVICIEPDKDKCKELKYRLLKTDCDVTLIERDLYSTMIIYDPSLEETLNEYIVNVNTIKNRIVGFEIDTEVIESKNLSSDENECSSMYVKMVGIRIE